MEGEWCGDAGKGNGVDTWTGNSVETQGRGLWSYKEEEYV